MSNNGKEIENLNLDDLDVEELEGRLELAIFGVFGTENGNCNGINYGTVEAE